MNKKLQVFVSSTYTDLIEERQAAVEAILDAGHIPAGMELFKAGNESQLKTIYKWIDESDVYMLILGGRYGSIESNSGISYTQLEYEYALNKNMPVFAVVLSDSFLTQKINNLGFKNATEQIAPDKYQAFKSLVMSKIIRAVDDCKDIKITIHSTLNEFMNKYDLIGWVRNNKENDTLQLLKDNNTLIKENNSLTNKIQKLQDQLKTKKQLGDYSFDELFHILKNKTYIINYKNNEITVNILDFFISNYSSFSSYERIENTSFFSHEYSKVLTYLEAYDLITRGNIVSPEGFAFITTKTGNKFYIMLESNNMI